MANRFFNPESGFWKIFSAILDILVLSILWVVFSLPLITIGPSTAALYVAVTRCTRKGIPGAIRVFWNSFRRNWKQGIGVSLILLLLCGLLTFLTVATYQLGFSEAVHLSVRRAATIFYIPELIIDGILLGIALYVTATFGRFEYTTKELFQISFRLALAHLPRTLLLVVPVFIAGYYSIQFYPLLSLFPGLAALYASLILEAVYAKHGTIEEASKD